jgi:hypothetical protein
MRYYVLTPVNSNVVAVHAMMAYGGMDVRLHSFLCLALIGSIWSAVRPGPFTPAERPRMLGRLQGRAMDVLENKISIFPARASNHGSFVILPVAMPR